MMETVRYPICDASNGYTSRAMAHQDDVGQFLRLDHVHYVQNEGIKRYIAGEEVFAFACSGERRRKYTMTL